MSSESSQAIHYELDQLLLKQKQAFLNHPMPSAKERVEKLMKLKQALLLYQDRLIDAVSRDFGNRSESETMIAEIFPLLDGIAYNCKHIKHWMRSERRHVPLYLLPSSAKVVYQPLGVVGIVSTWNFPLILTLSPLMSALAAGNRAMIKMSEYAPETAKTIGVMLNSIFSTDEVAVITGDVEVSQAFTTLNFDHLIFTGATSIGKEVMRAAAQNLTPVTLELGGKSPALIHQSFPIQVAAERIAFGKSMNAGQICVSPDYVFCHHSQVDALVNELSKQLSKSFPDLLENKDYTSIINQKQHQRLLSYLADAKEKGANIITINPANEDFSHSNKIPPTLLTHTNEDMLVEQEEIFGPILPIKGYQNIDEALDYIKKRPRPLALYYFDWNKQRIQHIVNTTHSGGVGVNETVSHVAVDALPFGGIGDSGMGHYHGKEGFLSLSKAKGVFKKGKFNPTKYVSQPWGNGLYRVLHKTLSFLLK